MKADLAQLMRQSKTGSAAADATLKIASNRECQL
jgi:hypothetical protein